jgi:hypothetical protein
MTDTSQAPAPVRLSIDDFVGLLAQWVQSRLKDIGDSWAWLLESEGGGDSWEYWVKIEFRNWLIGRMPALSFSPPKRVFAGNEICDFVLNDDSPNVADRIVVEFKTQTPGKLEGLTDSIMGDAWKLVNLSPAYADAQRLAVGLFFTFDFLSSSARRKRDALERQRAPMKEKGKLVGPEAVTDATKNFADRLRSFELLLLGDNKPLRVSPGGEEMERLIAMILGGPPDARRGPMPEKMGVYEVGICWRVPSRQQTAPTAGPSGPPSTAGPSEPPSKRQRLDAPQSST